MPTHPTPARAPVRPVRREDEGLPLIYTRYITVRGKRIFHPTGGLFVFPDRRGLK
jgi:hypothetical protein